MSAAQDIHPAGVSDQDEKSCSQDGVRHNAGSFHASEEDIPKSAGVRRMEGIALAGDTKGGRYSLYLIALLMFLMYWIYSMASSTTYSYDVWATSSFGEHSGGLATLSIATGIISSVINPFLAKFCDIFTRTYMLIIILLCYVCGYVMILECPNITTFYVGQVFVSIGSAGLQLLTSIYAADLVPLQYRGLAQGILSSPYIVTVWYTSEIAAALADAKNWRWGYGMYAIIFPVIMTPCIAILIWLDRRAVKTGRINIASSSGEAQRAAKEHAEANGGDTMVAAPVIYKAPLKDRAIQIFHELDTIGLLLLGFGWALLLLPFSLRSGAEGGYSNPSLIAMFAVGAVCLIFYVIYERMWARYPTAPMRLLKNKTFITAVIIDFMYMLAGYMQSLYLSSYAYVVTDWTTQEWNYYNNTLTISLCLFGVFAGLWMRFTHRYKLMQIVGLIIKMIAYGILVNKNGVHDTARLVTSQVLVGLGGSLSVVASQVSSQASVPHQDVALVISLLTLWSAIGRAIGDSISVSVWTDNMPRNLRQFLPASVNDTQIAEFFGDITLIKAYDFDSEVRQGAIKAYEKTVFPLWAGALGLSFIPIIAACYQTNYYLGSAQNMYDGHDTAGRPTGEHKGESQKPKSKLQKILSFWDQ